jgi:hypothetical protein
MKQSTLAVMGIQTWERRTPLSAKQNLTYQTFRLQKNNDLWGFLLLENLANGQEIANLLRAIMDAINMEYVACKDVVTTDTCIIIMGIQLGAFLKETYPDAIVTYHPLELLENPNLKRDVWMTLKQFK